MSQISESEVEDIMKEIERMNLDETKNINLIGHVGGPNKIKEKYPKTFKRQHKIHKYELKESKI